ncbi:MAG: prolyl oligopeptidase family serine peptidase [Robiginitomaculum sp.]|nr:prolyl oligopeptidase family serine peptidase [Robiginitomaculum sp.]
MALSPDGSRIAYILHRNGTSMMLVRELDNPEARPMGIDVSKLKARAVSWANDRYVLLHTSITLNTTVFTAHKIEFGGVFSYDTVTRKARPLLHGSKQLGINASLGRIDRILPEEDAVLMPAFTGQVAGERVRVLFKVSLKTGKGRIVARGYRTQTDHFIVNGKGQTIARIDFADKTGKFVIKAIRTGIWQDLYTEDSKFYPLSVTGLSTDGKSLMILDHRGRDTLALYAMSLADGSITGPIQAREKADIDHTLADGADGVVRAVAYADISGTDYVFIDPDMASTWKAIKKALAGSVVKPLDWSANRRKWLLYVEGGRTAGAYMLYDTSSGKFRFLASVHPDIRPEDIADVVTIAYKSKDGTRISALLTLPPGYEKHPAAMVVLPHGGPASHDSLGWDWLAQFLANQGYLVLQPNFRGSDGFGAAFENAGDGEWSGIIVDDVTAGVRGMIRSGYADPKRICIVGASFGGYMALAGLVFTPDIYACSVAIAPISDASAFIADRAKGSGRKSSSVSYWQEAMMGEKGKAHLDTISPAKHAAAAKAPLLLIHGKDDTVVPIAQSRIMKRAMDRTGKPVQMMDLKGEDHWLSRANTRIATLRALEGFLKRYLAPANTQMATEGRKEKP